MDSRFDSRWHRRNIKELRNRQFLTISSQIKQLVHIPRALGLVWAGAPAPTMGFVILMVIRGAIPACIVYLTRHLVNSLVALIGHSADQALWGSAISAAVMMALVMVTGEVLTGVSEYVETVLSEHTQDHMQRMIQTKAIALDLQFFESPEYYDLLQRAGTDAINRPIGLLRSIGDLLQSTITLIAMAGVLIEFVWWMPLALLAGTLPALWVALRNTWRFNQWRLDNTENQRYLDYYKQILMKDFAAPELRLFRLGKYFMDAYWNLRKTVCDERLKIARDHLLFQISAGILGLAVMAVSMLWVGWQAIQSRFSIGDIAMFWQALNQGQRLMKSLLSGAGELYRNLLFLEDLFAFMGLEPVLRDPEDSVPAPKGLLTGLRFDQLGFSYPNSNHVALSNFTLEVPAGKIVAIVGENGAGKSTLIKLICRFYDPDMGRITWDGVDLRQIKQEDLRRCITVLFQQFQSYHMTVAENIALGDIDQAPDPIRLSQAAVSAGADSIIAKRHQGYEMLLGKWFGHAELSTGEWQRLALARAFFRQAPLVVLDEPTSAMDSWAEATWMNQFRDLVADRTAIIITHRFTTAMQADVIHVMDQGRIVESGTHNELVALGGRYAGSWKQQMRDEHYLQ